MRRKIYITFSGGAYDGTTEKIIRAAPRFGAEEVWVYDDLWIKEKRPEFMQRYRWAFEHHHKRGFGWYIWKPYVILQALERAQIGDIILFTDADTWPIGDLNVLYETCEKDGGIMLFTVAAANQRQWCKRDCFIVMGQDDPKYYDRQAAVARFILVQKGAREPERILREWLDYTGDQRCNTFDPSVLGPELPGFIEHRCEQAILTNLAHKYELRLYREADQSGDRFSYDKDLFPTLFRQDSSVGRKYKSTTVPLTGSRFRNVG